MKCVAFFSDDDDLQIIRYFSPGSANKTDKNIKSMDEVFTCTSGIY